MKSSASFSEESVALSTPSLPAASQSATARRWADFYELTKPRLNSLVVITTAVGYYMAAHASLEWLNLVHTIIGTALTAAGAGALNQFLERQLDGLMARTANRPLPGNRLGPAEALVFALGLSAAGVAYLALLVNPLTAALGAATLLSYVLIYTPLKRHTPLCTIVGAVPGAVPPMMGWTAVHNHLGPEAWALFGILFIWQIPHFLAIAVLYRDQYAAAGFKMLPVIDPGLRTTSRQIVLYSMALAPLVLMPTTLRMAGPIYLAMSLLLTLIFIAFAVHCGRRPSRAAARALFIASILYLPLLLAAMMIDKL